MKMEKVGGIIVRNRWCRPHPASARTMSVLKLLTAWASSMRISSASGLSGPECLGPGLTRFLRACTRTVSVSVRLETSCRSRNSDSSSAARPVRGVMSGCCTITTPAAHRMIQRQTFS